MNTKKILKSGLIAVMIAIIFSTCNNGSTDSTSQTARYTSTAYTLIITESTAKYTAKGGDAYELTAGSKKSTGTVSAVSNSVITLKPSNSSTTFTATVSGDSLIALNGTITWTDGSTNTAPGSLTTVGSGGTPENPVGTVYLGETLTLSGQVYDWELLGTDPYFRFLPYNGSHAIEAIKNRGGNGAITNGLLNFTIGKPNNSIYSSFDEYFLDSESSGPAWGNIQANKNNVIPFSLSILYFDDTGISHRNIISLVNGNTSGTLSESVVYIYVEEDVTVSGKGTTETGTLIGGDYYYTKITKDFSLALKKGWNAVYSALEQRETFSGTIDNPTINIVVTSTMFLSNPPLKWFFW